MRITVRIAFQNRGIYDSDVGYTKVIQSGWPPLHAPPDCAYLFGST